MKKYTLPQYYVIKRDENNSLWREFIDFLNKTYKQNWTGYNYLYYGFTGHSTACGTQAENNIYYFKNSPTLITLEQWKSSFEKDFVLPENWCILRTEYNYEKVNEYFNFISSKKNYYQNNNDYINNRLGFIKNGQQITTKQFIEHVYNPKFKKENTMEVKLTIEFLNKAYNTAKTQNDNTVQLIRAEVNPFALTTTQAFVDRMKERFKNCSYWSVVLEKEFPTKKEIEWDKIKTGSVVMIEETRQYCNGIENIELSKPVNVIFYKTTHNINKKNIFSLVGCYNFYSTFEQNGKFILFGSNESVDYITEVISY